MRGVVIARALAWSAAVIAAVAFVGITSQAPLFYASWGSGGPTMKVTTSVCAFLVAMGLFASSDDDSPFTEEVLFVTSVLSLALLLLTVGEWRFATSDNGIVSSLHWSDSSVESVASGIPSVGSMLGLLVLSLALSIEAIFGRMPRLAGAGVSALGLFGLGVGYGIGWPLGRYYVEGWSSGMALPTAVVLGSLGASMEILARMPRRGKS